MKDKQLLRKRIITFFTITLLWVLIALFLSFVSFVMASQGDMNYSLSIAESILFEIVCISPWIVCTPGIIWLAREYNFSRDKIWQSTFLHFLAALGVFSFHSIVQSSAVFLFFDDSYSWSYVKIDFIGFADMRVLLYVGVLLGVYTVDYYRKNRDSILKEPRIRAELNKLNFQKILNHLQPDFLINSIDTIKKDVRENPQRAEKHLIEVSTLLRLMLQNIRKEEVTLKEDQDFIDLYLDLTEKRLGIEIERIDEIDPICYGAYIPNFLFIMPFFEELINYDEENLSKLRSFTNKGWIENGFLHLDGIIEEVNLTNEDLAGINRNIKMGEILTRLHDRYGEDLQLRTFMKENRIHIRLSLPIKREDPVSPGIHDAFYRRGTNEY